MTKVLTGFAAVSPPEGVVADDGKYFRRYDAELASYCLHALTEAATLTSAVAVERLGNVTLDGLRPTR